MSITGNNTEITEPMTTDEKINELQRLRNRHVAKVLDYLGETPPYLETAIKRAMSMFAEDVQANIINSESKEAHRDYGPDKR